MSHIVRSTVQGEQVTLATCEKREYAELIRNALQAYKPPALSKPVGTPFTEVFNLAPDQVIMEEVTEEKPGKNIKLQGFIRGFKLAFLAREQQETLSKARMQELAEQAATAYFPFLESASQMVQDYRQACQFGLHTTYWLLTEDREAYKRFAEWQSWLPIQREARAQTLAEEYLKYL